MTSFPSVRSNRKNVLCFRGCKLKTLPPNNQIQRVAHRRGGAGLSTMSDKEDSNAQEPEGNLINARQAQGLSARFLKASSVLGSWVSTSAVMIVFGTSIPTVTSML